MILIHKSQKLKIKIPDASSLVNKTNFDLKVTETKNKIPDTTN